MMRATRKRGCFRAVVALFSTAGVAAILNIWSSSMNGGVWGVGATWNAKDDEGGEPPIQPKRVAVCFFGLTRSLRWTLPSIETRLLGVLRDSGIEVDVFVHTYRLVEVGYDGVRHACYSYEYGYEVPGISSEHTQSSGSMHPPPTAFERAECKLSLMLRLIGYYCRYQTDAGIRRAIYSRKQASDLQMYCSR